MERFSSFEELSHVKENTVIINPDKSVIKNSDIIFNGKHNVLFVEDGVTLANSKINFNGENSVIYIRKSCHSCLINVTVYNESAVFLGKNSYYNGTVNIIASERQNVIIGDDCLFSFGIWIRTADPHLIYSTETKRRLNYSKSVYIGDHIWIGQGAMILKGCEFGSGSILGGASVASGKKIPSNTSYAGNPAKFIQDNIFYSSKCVHAYDEAGTEESGVCDTDKWIFNESINTIDIPAFDASLKSLKTADEKLSFIKTDLIGNEDKNRFFKPSAKKKSLFFKKKRK